MASVELTSDQTAFLRSYLDAEIPEEDPTERLVADINMEAASISDIYMMGRQAATSAVSALQAKLANSDDPNAKRIAEFGLMGLTGRNHVQIMQAILAYENSAADTRAENTETLLSAFAELEKHLAESKLVDLVEDNASDVPVSIRKPLSAAIATIRRKIRA
jgi:hypothetical protein